MCKQSAPIRAHRNAGTVMLRSRSPSDGALVACMLPLTWPAWPGEPWPEPNQGSTRGDVARRGCFLRARYVYVLSELRAKLGSNRKHTALGPLMLLELIFGFAPRGVGGP